MIAGIAATAMKLIPIGPPTSIASWSSIFFFLLHCFLPQKVHPDGLRTRPRTHTHVSFSIFQVDQCYLVVLFIPTLHWSQGLNWASSQNRLKLSISSWRISHQVFLGPRWRTSENCCSRFLYALSVAETAALKHRRKYINTSYNMHKTNRSDTWGSVCRRFPAYTASRTLPHRRYTSCDCMNRRPSSQSEPHTEDTPLYHLHTSIQNMVQTLANT